MEGFGGLDMARVACQLHSFCSSILDRLKWRKVIAWDGKEPVGDSYKGKK